ncbi:MAG: sigma-54 factor interaction domain-containing protein, partial [candidate division Zixibacteria bacterium]|nr:sigma-54 factor interaction domain-containing protein [candidate division Zixibacteria bacterium]
MSQNILILVSPEYIAGHPPFDEIFKSEGEYIYELSQLYSILKERAIELILVAEDYPGINQGTIRRIRMRSPLADVWRIVPRETPYSLEDNSLFDGAIIMADGRESVLKRISKILFQKGLLRKFHLVGRSEKLKMIAETIDHLISSDISVLIIGPSGSGKELVARAIHENSPRTKGRFITVNCGALAEGVLESELFGHSKGAFTGSVGKRDGLFLQANGGTIFLDEIGETKPDTQVRLLRVLENGVFYPVGGDYPVHSDVRVIAATNRDLAEAIHEGVFREDLYFRLGVIKINLPSLYERREDILPLLYHFAAV